MSAYSEANRDVVRLLVSLLSHIFNSITTGKKKTSRVCSARVCPHLCCQPATPGGD